LEYSSNTQYAELPNRVKAAILDCKPTRESKFDQWIHQKISALSNKSVVETLAEFPEEGELKIIALCSRIKGV
jgi:hypothetical protein